MQGAPLVVALPPAHLNGGGGRKGRELGRCRQRRPSQRGAGPGSAAGARGQAASGHGARTKRPADGRRSLWHPERRICPGTIRRGGHTLACRRLSGGTAHGLPGIGHQAPGGGRAPCGLCHLAQQCGPLPFLFRTNHGGREDGAQSHGAEGRTAGKRRCRLCQVGEQHGGLLRSHGQLRRGHQNGAGGARHQAEDAAATPHRLHRVAQQPGQIPLFQRRICPSHRRGATCTRRAALRHLAATVATLCHHPEQLGRLLHEDGQGGRGHAAWQRGAAVAAPGAGRASPRLR